MFKKILPSMLLVLGTTMFLSSANAEDTATLSAVNKSACAKLVNTTEPFILVLDSGDDLVQSITQCAKDAKLQAATVNGLGQVHNPTLAYFSGNAKDKPALKTFAGYYELASLSGDITNNENKYFTHLHAVLADKDFHGIAGHVDKTKVGMTAEITIKPLANIQRSVDPSTGFGSIMH